MRCGQCDKTTGVIFNPLPAKVKCSIDNQLHEMSEQCKIEFVPIVRCKDCYWGKDTGGNIECWTDLNAPPEYHGYDWFCPNGERRWNEQAQT